MDVKKEFVTLNLFKKKFINLDILKEKIETKGSTNIEVFITLFDNKFVKFKEDLLIFKNKSRTIITLNKAGSAI